MDSRTRGVISGVAGVMAAGFAHSESGALGTAARALLCAAVAIVVATALLVTLPRADRAG